MTNKEWLQKLVNDKCSVNLVKFLDSLEYMEDQPWLTWFTEEYCNKCKPIKAYAEYFHKEIEISPCEPDGCGCLYFKETTDMPDNSFIIEKWLEAEYKE